MRERERADGMMDVSRPSRDTLDPTTADPLLFVHTKYVLPTSIIYFIFTTITYNGVVRPMERKERPRISLVVPGSFFVKERESEVRSERNYSPYCIPKT